MMNLRHDIFLVRKYCRCRSWSPSLIWLRKGRKETEAMCDLPSDDVIKKKLASSLDAIVERFPDKVESLLDILASMIIDDVVAVSDSFGQGKIPLEDIQSSLEAHITSFFVYLDTDGRQMIIEKIRQKLGKRADWK